MPELLRRATDRIERRLEFERLISDLSSKFINLAPAEVDREIEDALRRVCEFLGIDFAMLWQWSVTSPGVAATTHFYPSRALMQPAEPMLQEHYPWYEKELLAGRMIAISSLDELPAEAAIDREHGHRAGIKSNLTLPLTAGGEPIVGALSFNTLHAERDWPDVLVNRLQLVAQVFTNALVRRRHELTLQESEERLGLAADSAGVGLWTLNYDTGVFWATDRARQIFGYSPDEILSFERIQASIHPDDRELVRGAIERSVNERLTIDVEYRILLPDGAARWIASRGRPRFKSTGELDRVMGVSTDVTERKRTEDAYRSSEARLAAGADLAGLAFYEIDFSERASYVDDRYREICGLPPERLKGLQPLEFWVEHIHPDDRQRVVDERAQMHDGGTDRLSTEYRFLHPDGGQKWIHHEARVARRDSTGRACAAFGVLRDITKSRQAEETLRDLSRRLIRAHEEERAILARELHDDVTQRLAVLAIDVGRAEFAATDGPHAAAMKVIRDGLVSLSEDVHSLAYQLHPSVLEELGLVEALRTECERAGRRRALDLSLDFDAVPASFGKDAAFCLFRIAQESLNNVLRHSHARSASVALREMDGGLLLAVRDDGVGFDPATPGKSKSLGLASMRERVRLVNGTLDIESAPGEGTAVIAWVPGGEARDESA